MKIQADSFTINDLIVHEVPINTDGAKPRFSDLSSAHDKFVTNFLETKGASSLTKTGMDVLFDEQSNSPLPKIIEALLFENKPKFVELSQQAAQFLFEMQAKNVSPGLFTMGTCSYGSENGVLLTKLEKTRGVSISEDRSVAGKLRLTIDFQPNLMLTEATRIFKIALFLRTGKTVRSVKGCASDTQQAGYGNHKVARFFLEDFLGCKLKERPDISTQRFFNAASAFINGLQDADEMSRYYVGLLAEMNGTSNEIQPQAFAARVLQPKHRKPFSEAVAKAGLPDGAIFKDVALISPSLKKMTMKFSHELTLFGTPESFKDRVEITKADDGGTQVVISDEIERFGR